MRLFQELFIADFNKNISPWCNGSTTVFGTVCQGSNPCGEAINIFKGYHFIMVAFFI